MVRANAVKTFGVQSAIDRRITPYPLGRLDVGSEELVLRAWPGWRGETLSVPFAGVQRINIGHFLQYTVLTIDDVYSAFGNVRIQPGLSTRRLLREFERLGYPLHDTRKSRHNQPPSVDS